MWSNKYIGIPFKERGRDFNGVDCWGLVRLIYKNEFNITLPSFVDDYTTTDDTSRLEELIAQYREGWDEITALESGAVILFKLLGSESHIAVAINDKQFIHISENSTSVVESIDSVLWRKRIVGYFKYNSSKNVILNTVPHPLKTERYTLPITPGTTLQQLHTFVVDEWKVAPELKSYAAILVNGRPITVERWDTFVLKDTDVVEYRAIPGKDVVRLALFVALAIYAPYIAGALEGGLIAATSGGLVGSSIAAGWAAGAVGSTFATMAVTIVGGALINAIAPVRPPTTKDPGTTEQQYMVTGGANQSNPYGAIPVILGKVRMTPALGAQNYATFLNERDSYLTMLLAWGYGPLNIDATTYKIGEVALNLGQQNQSYQFAKFDSPNQTQDMFITLDRKNDSADAANIEKFNTIYSSDVYQNLVNTALTGARDANNKAYSPLQNGNTQTQSVMGYVGGEQDQRYGETDQYTINAIPAGPWITAANNGDSVNTLVVDIHFPQGLSRINTKAGDREPAPVNIAIEYSTNGGTTWNSWIEPYTAYAGGKSVGGLIGSDAAKKDAFTISFEKNFPTGTTGTLSVRARRENGDDPDIVPDYRYSDTVTFLAATFYKTPSNGEILVDPRNSKIAKTALRIKATDQINGQLDGINAIVQTWLNRYNGTSWSYGTSSNPADLFRYVLQHPANPQPVTDSQLDLPQIQYWWNYCNQNRSITYTPTVGSQKTETFKLEYNSIIADTRSIMDILRDICAAGRASPALINGKWSVTIDEPKSNIVQHFTPHNSWGFEGIRALPKLPDGLRVNFLDEDNNYQQSEIIVYKTDKTASTAELFESIQLPGVTKAAAVVDHAKWHMAQAYLRREVYSLNADLEYLVCNRGDRVKVMHDVPMWGLDSGRVKNRLANDLLELDETVSINSSQNHTIRIRSSVGASTTRGIVQSFNIANASASNNVITITTSSVHSLSVGDMISVSVPSLSYVHNQVSVTAVSGDQLSFTYTQAVNSFGQTNLSGTVTLNSGYYKKVKLSSSTTTTEVSGGDLYLFGYLNQEAQDLLVISIEPTSNKSARLTLVDYGITDTYNLFTDYQTLNTTNTVFETQISLPPELNRSLYTSTQKPIITGVSSDETAGDLIAPVISENRIKIAFGHPADLPTNTAFIECEYDLSSAVSTVSTKSIRVAYPDNTIYIPNVLKNETYKYRLRYIASNGVVGLWTDFATHTVQGRVRGLTNVSNLSYDLNELNIELTWDIPIDSDYDTTELRYVTSAVPNSTESTQEKNTLWTNSTLIGYSKTGKFNWIKPASNNYRILAKHVGRSGNTSIVPRIVNVSWTNLIIASISSDLVPAVPIVSFNDSNQAILTGTGATITVKQGGTILKYDGVGTANGRWRISQKVDGTGLTSGSISTVQDAINGDNTATLGNLTSFTAETSATVTLTISGKSTFGDSFTITEIYKYNRLTSGKSSSLVFAYKRAPDNTSWTGWPTSLGPGSATFDFSTFQIDTSTDQLDNGWSKEIYGTGTLDPLWVTVATAKSSGGTDTITANEWSTPVKYSENGINTATVTLYKRTATSTLSTNLTPTASLKYTFSTAAISVWNIADTLNTILNGWSTTPPADSSGKYLWAIYASAASSSTVDEITTGQWTTPTIVAEHGNDGKVIDISGVTNFVVDINGVYSPSTATLTATYQNLTPSSYSWAITGATPATGSNQTITITPSANVTNITAALTITASGVNYSKTVTMSVAKDGSIGKRTATGIVHYQSVVTDGSTPSISNTGVSYNFTSGDFTGLSGWAKGAPVYAAGNSNKYYYVTYTVVETTAGGGTGQPTFGSVTQAIGFTGLVTFTAAESISNGTNTLSFGNSGTTSINGGNIITGTVTSDKIDTRNLTVKDANGNILFGAGTALDWSNISTSYPSILDNSNVTATSIGAVKTDLTNAPAGILNSNITATSLGAIKTDLTNAPAGILNSNLYISKTGAVYSLQGGGATSTTIDAAGLAAVKTDLTNAPTGIINGNISITETNGTITLSNAGTGSFTTITSNNKISSTNVATFMQEAAIGDAYIGNLSAGKITTGTLDAARIGAGSIDAGKLVIGASNTGSYIKLFNNKIEVYENNVLRVIMGNLS